VSNEVRGDVSLELRAGGGFVFGCEYVHYGFPRGGQAADGVLS